MLLTAQSIVELKDLGVKTEVLTGDTLPVAVNVCQRLELISRYVTENDDVQAIHYWDWTNQKASVTGSLRKSGHCVGMPTWASRLIQA
ncbi:hypothetical protein E4U30_008022 [Claviceps sp. LM220 group G6]|nr:hypothetical protein E4U15_006304 [Claviceps sp. LM218 group G6]KAG6098410.1 hypothetical protein E4U30_008022 [Claviceps sp. LM220 group G6]KAG6107437.1 hypothetical protein E4U31_000135 [Claviceps sp. LM219 group G6]